MDQPNGGTTAEKAKTAETQRFSVTARAAARISEILAEDKIPDQMLRVSVTGGGCAGFQYVFDFDASVGPDDVVIERDGAKVVIDSVSLELLAGSELDFVENLIGAFFAVNNPNATSSCGCGTSFSM